MNRHLTTLTLGTALTLAVLAPAAAGDLGDASGRRAALLNDPQVPAGSVMASQWDLPVSGKTSVSGNPQTADHATDWTKATAAKESVRGTAAASAEPYGFLAQALGRGGEAAASQLAAR